MLKSSRDFIDHWLMDDMLDMPSLLQEPAIDSSRALPLDLNVPSGESEAYKLISETVNELWLPHDDVIAAQAEVAAELGLGESNRGHVIGLHWRGGDKIAHECPQGNCGNPTLYLQTALNVLADLGPAKCADCRPTLVVMTIEPGVIELLQSDPLSAAFDIKPLAPPKHGLLSFNKGNFNRMSMEARIEGTNAMIRDLTVLSRLADAFVVTASSNVGRMAFLLGGPEHKIASVDVPLHATVRPWQFYLAKTAEKRSKIYFVE